MSGEVDHAEVGTGGLPCQLREGSPELDEAQVRLEDDLVEPELLLESIGHRHRIVHRVGQGPDLVVGVADHQCDAPRLRGWRREADKEKEKQGQRPKCVSLHAGSPSAPVSGNEGQSNLATAAQPCDCQRSFSSALLLLLAQ